MVTAPPREIRVPGAMLWYRTEPRPEKETLRPRLSSRNRASLSPMPTTLGIVWSSCASVEIVTFERESIRTVPQPLRSSNEVRGENLSAMRRIWAMSPPLIRRG